MCSLLVEDAGSLLSSMDLLLETSQLITHMGRARHRARGLLSETLRTVSVTRHRELALRKSTFLTADLSSSVNSKICPLMPREPSRGSSASSQPSGFLVFE